jgi:hypothetical protein
MKFQSLSHLVGVLGNEQQGAAIESMLAKGGSDYEQLDAYALTLTRNPYTLNRNA